MTSLLSMFCAVLLLVSTALTTQSANAAAPIPVPVRDKWALIIGIGQFEDAGIKPLPYGANSARALAKELQDYRWGRFEPGHVHVLVNGAATRYGIEQAGVDGWLLRKALPNDLIVVYIATRLAKAPDRNAYYLCAADSIASELSSTGISLESFLAELKKRTQSRRIICILDTAHLTPSADGESSAQPAHAVAAVDTNYAAEESVCRLVNDTGVSVLSAGELGENCCEPPAVNSESCLVHYLDEVLRSTQGGATLHMVSQYVTQVIEDEGRKAGVSYQKPVLILSADNEFLAQIPLGIEIKHSSALEGLHFGHPMSTLALDRPDLDEMINTHLPDKSGMQEDAGSDASFSASDFSSYLSRMKQNIQTKWRPPAGFEDRSVATTFTIAKDGTIADASVVGSSGNAIVDDSALAALKAASPLEPLPPGSPESVRIRYKFNWHVKAGR